MTMRRYLQLDNEKIFVACSNFKAAQRRRSSQGVAQSVAKALQKLPKQKSKLKKVEDENEKIFVACSYFKVAQRRRSSLGVAQSVAKALRQSIAVTTLHQHLTFITHKIMIEQLKKVDDDNEKIFQRYIRVLRRLQLRPSGDSLQ